MATKLSRYIEAVLEMCALAAVLLIPVFFNTYSQRMFEPDKIALLRSLALVMIVGLVVLLMERGSRSPAGKPLSLRNGQWHELLLHTPLVLPTLLFIVVYLIATLFSISPQTSLWGSYQRLQGTYSTVSYIVVFAVIATVLWQREQVDRLITVVILGSIPVALYGIVQHYNLDPLSWVDAHGIWRVAGNMGNPIFIAAYLIMVVPLTLGRLVDSFHSIQKEERISPHNMTRTALYILILALEVIVILWTGSRGPWLGLIASVWVFGLFGLLMLKRSDTGRGMVRLSDIGLALGGMLLANVTALVVSVFLILGASVLKILKSADVTQYPLQIGATTLISLSQLQIGLITLGFLGLGMLFTFAYGLFKRTWRWVWLAAVIEFVFLIGFLGLLNMTNGPLEYVRQGHTIQRLSTIFDAETSSGKVRTLIWQGALKLALPHAPLVFPDESQDRWNVIRPLIGYGPESMYVAYNRFYSPDLAHYEYRNRSPDRSHNETFDALINTGLFGLLVFLFLFGSIFYYGYRWLGWIGGRRTAWLFAGLWGGGVLLGSATAVLIHIPHYLGIAIPAGGIAMALIVYLILYALFRYGIELRAFLLICTFVGLLAGAVAAVAMNLIWMLVIAPLTAMAFGLPLYHLLSWAFADFVELPETMTRPSNVQFMLAALVAAVIGHFVEINMGGVAIAPTRTLFWTFSALMLVIGYTLPRAELATAHSAELTVQSTRKPRKRTVAGSASRLNIPVEIGRWLGPMVALSLILALVLITQVYELLNANAAHGGPGSAYSMRVMILVTWLIGLGLIMTELAKWGHIGKDGAPSWLSSLEVIGGISFVLMLMYYFVMAGLLQSLAGVESTDKIETFSQRYVVASNKVGDLLTLYYVFVFGVIFAGGTMLMRVRKLPTAFMWPAGAAVAGIGVLAALMLTGFTNLNVIRADTFCKQGMIFDKQATELDAKAGRLSAMEQKQREVYWQTSVDLYQHAIDLAPAEDYYYLPLGRAYLQYARVLISDPEKQDQMIHTAEGKLIEARTLNPLNSDHTANLARLYRHWAELKRSRKDMSAMTRYYQEADRTYRLVAETLSPHNATLWTEWCDLHGRGIGDWKRAIELCRHSLEIDNRYDATHATMGDLYVMRIDNVNGKVPLKDVQELYARAGEHYAHVGQLLTKNKHYSEAATYYNKACLMSWQGNDPVHAVDACRQVITISKTTMTSLHSDSGLWNMYSTLIKSLEALGDHCQKASYKACAQQHYSQGVVFGEDAVKNASKEHRSTFQKQLDRLNQKLTSLAP